MQAERDRVDVLGRLFARAEALRLTSALAVSVTGTVLITTVDTLVTPLLALSVFYLLPVLFAACRSGRLGVFSCVLTASAWCGVDLFKHGAVYGTPLVPLANALSRLLVLGIVVLLVTALRQDRQREAAMARVDPLTGLANARSFYDAVEQARRDQARTGQPVTLAYLDLDDFKSVNDDLGHAEGDRVLRQVGDGLVRAVRQADTVARLGGDEFALLLPRTDEAQAGRAMSRVREQLTQVLTAAPGGGLGPAAPVQVSIGAVSFASAPASVDVMIDEADGVMYQVKRAGKNQVLVTSR